MQFSPIQQQLLKQLGVDIYGTRLNSSDELSIELPTSQSESIKTQGLKNSGRNTANKDALISSIMSADAGSMAHAHHSDGSQAQFEPAGMNDQYSSGRAALSMFTGRDSASPSVPKADQEQDAQSPLGELDGSNELASTHAASQPLTPRASASDTNTHNSVINDTLNASIKGVAFALRLWRCHQVMVFEAIEQQSADANAVNSNSAEERVQRDLVVNMLNACLLHVEDNSAQYEQGVESMPVLHWPLNTASNKVSNRHTLMPQHLDGAKAWLSGMQVAHQEQYPDAKLVLLGAFSATLFDLSLSDTSAPYALLSNAGQKILSLPSSADLIEMPQLKSRVWKPLRDYLLST